MPTALYFDCFSGISGDMALGALLDAGLELGALRRELDRLELPGWQITAERGRRGFLSGTRALVDAPEQATHRHLADVTAIIERSTLAPRIQQLSIAVFTRLAEAEGKVHGIAASEVHFHEVGALDAIIDVVGVVAGLSLLGIEHVFASPLPLGAGWVRAAHGLIPIPAPATLELLAAAGAPSIPDESGVELVTPTGAALLATLATFERPAMQLSGVGYGLGKRDLERPNALRVWLGSLPEPEIGAPAATTVLLECNIDDMPANQLAYVTEQLFALGALDVWQTPIAMKKGRAAILLAVLVAAELESAAVDLIIRETTTLGVRRRAVERYTCERAIEDVPTSLGIVRVKRKFWQGQDLGAMPEYEDCARLARAHGLALHEVYQQIFDALGHQQSE